MAWKNKNIPRLLFQEIQMREEDIPKMVISGAVIFFISMLCIMSFYTISAGERGVLLTFGKPNMEAVSEGLHFKIPLAQTIKKMDVKTQKYEADASAASRDLQIVSTNIAVNYHLIPDSVPVVYKEIGLSYQDRIIQPAVQEVVKASTAKFTAEELITRRAEVKEDIKRLLKERLQERNLIVEEISITNFDFSESFNEAIEAKVTAEQNALQAKNKLEQIKYEAEQTVEKAKAEAESLRLQRQEITPDLVKLRQIEVQRTAIEKWDGKLPQVTGGAIPFIDLTNLSI